MPSVRKVETDDIPRAKCILSIFLLTTDAATAVLELRDPPVQAKYPKFLPDEFGNSDSVPPWGDRIGDFDNGDIPDTGVVRKYEWTIQRALLAPDGLGKL
jgi:hypothetical protein